MAPTRDQIEFMKLTEDFERHKIALAEADSVLESIAGRGGCLACQKAVADFRRKVAKILADTDGDAGP